MENQLSKEIKNQRYLTATSTMIMLGQNIQRNNILKYQAQQMNEQNNLLVESNNLIECQNNILFQQKNILEEQNNILNETNRKIDLQINELKSINDYLKIQQLEKEKENNYFFNKGFQHGFEFSPNSSILNPYYEEGLAKGAEKKIYFLGYNDCKCNVPLDTDIIDINYKTGYNDGKIDENGLLVVNKSNINDIDIYYTKELIKKIIIKDDITVIPERKFANFVNLQSIIFPKSLKKIGKKAFHNCINLENIEFPNKNITIEENAFKISSNKIKYDDFNSKLSFKKLSLTDSILKANALGNAKIDTLELTDCEIDHAINIINVNNIILNNSYNTNKEELILSDLIVEIEIIKEETETSENINGSNIKDILHILEEVGNINITFRNYKSINGTFSNKQLIKSVSFENVSSIKNFSKYKNLSEVKIANLKEIKESCFEDCENLTAISLPENVTEIKCRAFARSGLRSITVPENITEISESCFEDCKYLRSVILPENLTKIKCSAFAGSGLRSITIPKDITEISESCFEDCKNLESITLPENVTEIKCSAFAGSGLRSIIIPKYITEISESCFEACENLESITLPHHLNKIRQDAFSLCINLKSIKNLYENVIIEEPKFKDTKVRYIEGISNNLQIFGMSNKLIEEYEGYNTKENDIERVKEKAIKGEYKNDDELKEDLRNHQYTGKEQRQRCCWGCLIIWIIFIIISCIAGKS